MARFREEYYAVQKKNEKRQRFQARVHRDKPEAEARSKAVAGQQGRKTIHSRTSQATQERLLDV